MIKHLHTMKVTGGLAGRDARTGKWNGKTWIGTGFYCSYVPVIKTEPKRGMLSRKEWAEDKALLEAIGEDIK